MSNEGLEIDINLEGEDVRAWGGESGPVLPIGTYTFDITAAVEEPSKKNQPCVKVTFKVIDEGEFFGVELNKKYSLQPKALGRFKNLMMAAGCRLDKIRLGELVGSRIIAGIVHTPGLAQPDAEGNVVASDKMYCDIVNETAIEQPAAPTPPPPAAKGKGAAAAAPVAQGNKNGTVARRA